MFVKVKIGCTMYEWIINEKGKESREFLENLKIAINDTQNVKIYRVIEEQEKEYKTYF